MVVLGTLAEVAMAHQNLAASLKREVSPGEVVQQIEELATFSDAEWPAVTRVIFSKPDLSARKYVTQLMGKAGLKVS